jgi:hypothetical protein
VKTAAGEEEKWMGAFNRPWEPSRLTTSLVALEDRVGSPSSLLRLASASDDAREEQKRRKEEENKRFFFAMVRKCAARRC